MFRTIDDFKTHWKYETEATQKILDSLTDESLAQKVKEDGRSLGFLGWHLAQTPGEMLGLVGLKIDAPEHSRECPEKASEIAEAYRKAARSAAEQIDEKWTDQTLEQKDEMYGETWSRGLTLFYMLLHQTHHRGQMTVLMRQAGLQVPGVYGPAKEEWESMGQAALP